MSHRAATGTGTDCIAVASIGNSDAPYCGKHTKLGEIIGQAAYSAVKNGLLRGSITSEAAAGGKYNES